MNEEKTTTSNYILNFNVDVQQLTDYFILYSNLMKELEFEYKEDIEKINEEHRQLLNQNLTNLRFAFEKSYIHCITIAKSLEKDGKEVDIKKIEQLYKECNKKYIVLVEDMRNFTIEINSFLVENFSRNTEDSLNIYD